MSEQTFIETKESKIAEALAKAQKNFTQPELNRTAEVKKEGKLLYQTHYADLNNCIECIRNPLTENGLSFTQTIEHLEFGWSLVLTLRHLSGEVIKSFFPLNMNGTAQVIGGQLTYFKRYQITAFFGLAADFDDDGNSDTGNSVVFSEPQKTKPVLKKRDELEKEKQSPSEIVMPFGKATGKKLGSLDTDTLVAARDWMKSEMEKDPKPANMKQIAFIYSQVKAVLMDRGETLKPSPPSIDYKEPMPENESQDSADYVMAREFEDLPVKGKSLKQIPEAVLKQIIKIIDAEMKQFPPLNVSENFQLRNQIVSFLKSVGSL